MSPYNCEPSLVTRPACESCVGASKRFTKVYQSASGMETLRNKIYTHTHGPILSTYYDLVIVATGRENLSISNGNILMPAIKISKQWIGCLCLGISGYPFLGVRGYPFVLVLCVWGVHFRERDVLHKLYKA